MSTHAYFARKQREYRARMKAADSRRIQVWLPIPTIERLKTIAETNSQTIQATVAALIERHQCQQEEAQC